MTTIDRIILTLNSIEVHGEDNLLKLAGCINALREINTANVVREQESQNG